MKRYMFIIGAQRSGTTLLANSLDLHPEINFAKPIRPEPKYLLNMHADTSMNDYEVRYFSGLPDTVMRGEKSTSYIEYEAVAERIANIFPGARCVAMLRDPVERAISNYWFSVQHGFEKRSPDQALDPTRQDLQQVAGLSASPFAYLERGHYLNFLTKYANLVGKDKLLVLQTERFVRDVQVWDDLCRFLGLTPMASPVTDEKFNSVPRERSVSSKTIAALTAHFAPYNAALAMQYTLDLSLWRS
ncbi:MAG TPA: sulfotransferase [Gammaproteobacteria bacterium]|nr:sulfotransferase [Gammaproteobacteria bacterium]